MFSRARAGRARRLSYRKLVRALAFALALVALASVARRSRAVDAFGDAFDGRDARALASSAREDGMFERWFGASKVEAVVPPREPPRYEERAEGTPFGRDGGPKAYGNAHRVDCGKSAALLGFRFDADVASEGTMKRIRNAYTCVEALHDGGTTFGAVTYRETKGTASGSRWHRRDDFSTVAEHDVDCGESFLASFVLKQWSKSMAMSYACTAGKTPSPAGCETLESMPFESAAVAASAFVPAEVRCSPGSALTRFKFNDMTIDFTCCPTPALGG